MAGMFDSAFDAMASRCTLRLGAADERHAATLAQLAIAEVKRIEEKYSRYRADSVVARINAAAGAGWTDCDDETVALLNYAHTLHAASGGLFDITSGVLRRAWDFRRAQLPSPAALAALRRLIGWPRVQRDSGRIRLPERGMEIDFGGFGKEYAADRAAALLMEHGVRHGYVNLGGDMRFIGPQPDGQPWIIAIQDPRNSQNAIASIPVSRGALATSGDYERYFDLDGQRYCHILDPHSGMPVRHWQSVSVLAPLTIAAGSTATIAMLQQRDGLAFLEGSGMAWLAVDHQGTVLRNDNPA